MSTTAYVLLFLLPLHSPALPTIHLSLSLSSLEPRQAILLAALAYEETPLTPPFLLEPPVCPQPYSCDGGLALGPWQLHVQASVPWASLQTLDTQAQVAATLPCGAWTTCPRARALADRFLRRYPPERLAAALSGPQLDDRDQDAP